VCIRVGVGGVALSCPLPAGPVGIMAVSPRKMLPSVGDLGGDGMDPVERVEDDLGVAGARIGWGADDDVGALPANRAGGEGYAGDVSHESLERGAVAASHGLGRANREPRPVPGEQVVHELLGEAMGLVEPSEDKSSEDLFDDGGVDVVNRLKLSLWQKAAGSNHGMDVRIEVRGEGAEGLYGEHDSGARILAFERRLEGLQDGGIGGPSEDPEESTVASEQAAESSGDRQDDVVVGDRFEDLGDELLGEQGSALGLARGTEVTALAAERPEVLLAAARAPNPRESGLEASAGQVGLDGRPHDRSERAPARLETVFVDAMVLTAGAEGHMVLLSIALLVASAGVVDHSGIKIPFFAFFAHDSGRRVKEAPANMLVAMAIAAVLCIGIGIFPGPLYSILPFPVDYVPYTATHVVTTGQLLLFAALAFAILMRTGLYPAELRMINLDTDWVYRKLLPTAVSFVRHVGGAAWGEFKSGFLRLFHRYLGHLRRTYSPTGLMGEPWPTGSTALWATIILCLVLLLAYL